MCYDAGKYIDAQKCQRYDEHVEKTIITLTNTVSHPGTMVVETFCGK